MRLNYINLFWLTSLFILSIKFSQAQIAVQLKNNQEFKYNLKTGSFSLYQNNDPIFEHAFSSIQLKGSELETLNLPTTRALKQKFKDNVGSGICYSIERPAGKGLKTLQNFYFYDNSSFIVLEIIIKGKNISSNSILPFNIIPQNLLANKNLTAVKVPFDNDTFISYDQIELTDTTYESSEVGILYNQESQAGLIAASLDQSAWKTGILAKNQSDNLTELSIKNGYTEVTLTRDSMGHGFVEGNIIRSPKIFISYASNWQDGMEEFSKFQRKLFPPYLQTWEGGTPVGWNSWGVIQQDLSWENATGSVDYFKSNLPDFRNENGKAYIDLDSFWDNMVPGGMSGDYSKLQEFATYCKLAGLEPGIYWAPFTDWGYKSGPSRKAEGSDYTFGELWTKTSKGYHELDGGRALDPTHPGTIARMKFILQRLKDCGFKMIKIDFLSHAAIESTGFYDPTIKTGMQAYAAGMKNLNDILDNQMLIYAAISPSLASYKYAHMRRIACDAWKTMDQTAYTLNSVTFGWWQTYLYDYIDADHLVFTGESHDTNIARFLSGVVAGPLILGDDFSKTAEWQKEMEPILQNREILSIVKNGKSFRPLLVIKDNKSSNLYFKKDGKNLYLVAFNFKPEVANIAFDLKEIGLTGNFKMKDLISQVEKSSNSELNIGFESAGAKVFRLLKE